MTACSRSLNSDWSSHFSAISTGRDSIDLISRLDRSHFPFPSAISTDRDSIVSFHICSATRSISFRDSTDLISHFPFQCNFQWPRLDSIINLISQSMMTQNQGDSNRNKFGLLVRSHCVSSGRSRNASSGIRRKSAFLSSTQSHLLVRVRYPG
jgi:hypothetical protein